MARSIEFDYGRAVDRATKLFWRKGYSGTSLRDLLKAIGIGEGSFYNTLKSKKHLYTECVKHYREIEGQKRGRALMSGSSTSEGVRALFAVLLDCIDSPQTPSRLCLLAGMMSEDVLADPDLREMAQEGMAVFRDRMVERLTADKNAGKLPANFDPPTVASVITVYMQGMWRMAMVSYDRAAFERQNDVFLSGLGL